MSIYNFLFKLPFYEDDQIEENLTILDSLTASGLLNYNEIGMKKGTHGEVYVLQENKKWKRLA